MTESNRAQCLSKSLIPPAWHMKFLLIAILALLPICLRAGTVGKTPNVLFLFSDDQRFDTIHALGNPEIKTPNLDRLVEQGFAFTRAHIMGAMQGAVCVPSRAMLMTGRTLFRATVPLAGNTIPPKAVLMPEVFHRAGYQTIGIGKWHNDRPSFNRAFAAGGPVFFGGMGSHTKLTIFDYHASGGYPKNQARESETFSSVLFADAAIKFLEQQTPDKPFFLYTAFTAPHDPRTPPKEYEAMYDPDKITLPPNFAAEHPFDNGALKIRDEQLLPWPRTPAAVRKEIALYYAMITHLDAEIGRLLQTLERRGLRENTLIVFAGDNGLAVGQHGLLGKQNLYEHSVRVPLIFAGPGIPKGQRSAALCYLLDVFPTLCNLTGLPVPPTVEGQSLAPVIHGDQSSARTNLFAAYTGTQRMIKDERWKAIWYPKLERWQLFDLEQDPHELRDLSANADHQPKLVRLKQQLAFWQKQVDDPLLKPSTPSSQTKTE